MQGAVIVPADVLISLLIVLTVVPCVCRRRNITRRWLASMSELCAGIWQWRWKV